MSITSIIVIIIALIAGGYYIAKIIKNKKLYRKYLKEPSPLDLTGRDIIINLLNTRGVIAKYAIYTGTSKDPFDGNYYFPDLNLFVLRREISDGKSLMAFCICCQLAKTAVDYKNGDLCKDRAVSIDGEYALKYVLNLEEIESSAQAGERRY